MNLAWCDLSQVIDRCVRLVQHKMDMGNIQLNLDLAADLPPVHCDPARSSRSSGHGDQCHRRSAAGGNLWISTQVNPDSAIELVIRDDGIGIPAEHLPHIFEPSIRPRKRAARGLAWPSARTLSNATVATSI